MLSTTSVAHVIGRVVFLRAVSENVLSTKSVGQSMRQAKDYLSNKNRGIIESILDGFES